MVGHHFTTRQVTGAATIAGALALGACWFAWWRIPSQMGSDGEVFAAVDALFTAVTARDANLLGQCEERLQALRQNGKLPANAASYLGGIVAQARAGRWEPAAQSLYDFMLRQRRDGPRRSPHPST